jgi:hypothetical protein
LGSISTIAVPIFMKAGAKQKSLGILASQMSFPLTPAGRTDKFLGYYLGFYRGNFIKMIVGGERFWIAKPQALQ